MEPQSREPVEKAIKELGHLVQWHTRIDEVHSSNAFYDKKNHTIFLFDWTKSNTDGVDYEKPYTEYI